MISSRDRAEMERRARRLPTIDVMALFLHKESGKPLWLCKMWAHVITLKDGLEINGKDSQEK